MPGSSKAALISLALLSVVLSDSCQTTIHIPCYSENGDRFAGDWTSGGLALVIANLQNDCGGTVGAIGNNTAAGVPWDRIVITGNVVGSNMVRGKAALLTGPVQIAYQEIELRLQVDTISFELNYAFGGLDYHEVYQVARQ